MILARADVTATVWQVHVKVGDRVTEDQEIIILESMKMEIPVLSPATGVVVAVYVQPHDPVKESQDVVAIEAD